MKTLALFDFDGTLYQKDSLIEFTRKTKGNAKFYQGMLWLFPQLSAFKLGMMRNERVKVKFLTFFFKDTAAEKFKKAGERFAHSIPSDLNPGIFDAFLKHIESGHAVCIVSASCAEWIQPWSDVYQVGFIGTKLEITQGKITGKLATKNCYGPEKVERIKAVYNLDDFETIQVYGKGKGDREMLQLARG